MAGGTEQKLQIHIAGKADGSLHGAVSTAQKALSSLGTAAGKIAKVTAAAVGAATTAAVAFAKSAVETGMEFDKSMSQVAATMGTTVDQIGDLRQFAMDMGAKTAFSATEAAEALNFMALAGYDAETSMAMLPNVLNLAAAGGFELQRASDMVTDAQSALGLTIEQTSAMVDQMALTSSKTNTSVEQLGDAILTVGGTAQYMAGGTAELNAVLGVLADNGIKGSEGGTHLRNMLLKLASPTKDATKLLDQLGVEVFDAKGNMRSFADIFPELNAAMSSMTDQEKLDAMSTLFNSRDIASATALLSTTTDRWEELGDAIEGSAGAAEQMANTQLDNLAGDITLWQSALEGAQIVLSDQLTPMLRDFVQFGTKGVGELTDAFKEGGLQGAMSALGGILSEAVSMVVEMLPTLVDAGMQLLGALGQGILDNLPVIIDAAVEIVLMLAHGIIQALPQLGAAVIQIIESLARSLMENLPAILDMGMELIEMLADGIVNGIPQLIDALPQAIDGILNFITEKLPDILQKGAEILQEVGNGIIQAIPQLVSKLPQVITSITNFITTNLPLILQTGMELLQNLTMGIIQAIPELLAQLPAIIQAIVSFITNNRPTIINMGVNLLVSLANGIIQAIPQLVAQLPQIIVSIATTLASNFPQIVAAGVDILTNLWDGIFSMIPTLVSNLPQIVSAIVQGIGAAVTAVVDIGKNIVKGVWEGISAMGSWIKEKVSGFFKGIVDGAKSLLGIKSPSKVFAGIGGFMAEGLGIGWEDEYASVKNGIEDGLNFDAGTVGIAADVATQTAAGQAAVSETVSTIAGGNTSASDAVGNALARSESDWIGNGMDAMQSGDSITNNSSEMSQPIQITYSPQYTFSGEAPSKDDLVEAARMSQDEFTRMANQWLKEISRTSLKGGLALA